MLRRKAHCITPALSVLIAADIMSAAPPRWQRANGRRRLSAERRRCDLALRAVGTATAAQRPIYAPAGRTRIQMPRRLYAFPRVLVSASWAGGSTPHRRQ